MQLQDLEINREQALSDLDNEWQSAKKQQSYSKPSPGLLNMRHMVKKMIRAQQFEEVKKLARVIEEKEREEIADASKRMNEDYHTADQRLKEQYDNELRVITSMHEMKLHNIARSRDQSLRPLYQRIDNLQKLKEQTAKSQKKTTQLMQSSTPRKKQSSISTSRLSQMKTRQLQTPQKQLPQLITTPKLALPPVQRIKRDAKSQMSKQATTKTSICRPNTLSRLSNVPDKNNPRRAVSQNH